MKKINIYESDSYLFHKENLENHPSAKLDVKKESKLEKAFLEYEDAFVMDDLKSLTPYTFLSEEEKKKHLNLYNHTNDDDNRFHKLLNTLLTDENGRKQYCPLCEINTANTLDHILPKKVDKGFPEFCDMPLNLFPMCGECNTNKGEKWLDTTGSIKYLNLYRDELPNVQFLFVSVNLENSILTPNFFLKTDILDTSISEKLKNTFFDFRIKNKYDEQGCLVFDEIKAAIQMLKKYETNKDIIKQNIRNDRNKLNYWKDVLFRECMDNADVFDFLYV